MKLGWDQAHRRKRRNETHAQYGKRLFLMWRAEQRNLNKERAAARGEAWEQTGSWRLEGDWPEVAALPPLDQVTGWSAKKREKSANGAGLFGGWTTYDLEKRKASG